MNEQERLVLLEDIMDLDEGTLKVEDKLSDYEEWDSLTYLTLISTVDERFGRKLTGDEIKAFETVADVIAIMQ